MSTRKHKKSAIPVGTQFSPDLVDLSHFLKVLVKESGNRQRIEEGLWSHAVRLKTKAKAPTKRNRSLPAEAAIQYGLLDKNSRATPLATHLAGLSTTMQYREFARHILLNLGGLRVLDAIDQMKAQSIAVTGDSLAQYLTSQGFNVSVHNTAINSMRMWLARAGVFASEGKGTGAWDVVARVKRELAGLGDETISILSGLAPHQLAFVEALCMAAPKAEYVASEIRALAMTRHPEVRFSPGSLPKDVLEDLRLAGLIEYEGKGTQGGKSSILRTTPAFDRDVLQVFVTRTVKHLDSVTANYFMKSPDVIYTELESTNTAVKGRALEALSVRVMRLLGLRFVAWRKRAREATGQAEVDAVMAGVFGAVPTRWQIQCKNTPGGRVDLEDIAKEVGLVPITNATHLLFLANCDFTREATEYAQQIMFNSPVTIFLLGRRDFVEIRKDDSRFGRLMRAKAEDIVRQVPQSSVFAWK